MGNVCLTTVMYKTAQPYSKCVAVPWIHMVECTSAPHNSVIIFWAALCPIPPRNTTIPEGLGFYRWCRVSISLDCRSSELFCCECESFAKICLQFTLHCNRLRSLKKSCFVVVFSLSITWQTPPRWKWFFSVLWSLAQVCVRVILLGHENLSLCSPMFSSHSSCLWNIPQIWPYSHRGKTCNYIYQ
jgi:hypothetical protein